MRHKYKEPISFVKNLYYVQKNRCRRRGHDKPGYTSDELYDWMTTHPKFNKMWKRYERLGFQPEDAPSVDRIDNDVTYRFDNIRLMSWKKHRASGHVSNKANPKAKPRILVYPISMPKIKGWVKPTDTEKLSCNPCEKM